MVCASFEMLKGSKKTRPTVVVCSGGLDSVTLAYRIARESELAMLLSFDYGQKHLKELEFASKAAVSLTTTHKVIDLTSVGQELSNSALTGDQIDIPDGHYAEDNMRVTIVPNRNTIMLAVAFGLTASLNARFVAIAVHGGDHFIYPDCRPAFIDSFQKMQRLALDGVANIELYAPFLNYSKSDIVSEGSRLGVPFADTWSCYKGDETHCGRCGTCVERQEAFHLAKVIDPTEYVDNEFWKATT